MIGKLFIYYNITMEKEKHNAENLWLSKYPLLKDDYISNELFQTMSEKLSRVSQEYRDTINKESESGEEISEKYIYEADLSDIEKRFDKNSTEYRIFQALKKQWLRIFINPKTDVSYTDKYNIIRWLGPVSRKSKDIMGNSASDEDVYMTKLIHEMWHSTLRYNAVNNPVAVGAMLSALKDVRWRRHIPVTKLWDDNRYPTIDKKVNEDCVEFIRMYTQNPVKFKEYLKNTLNNENLEKWSYTLVENFIQKLLNDNIGIEQ